MARGTWPMFGYRGPAKGLKSWPCLGPKYSKNPTLSRTTPSISRHCWGQETLTCFTRIETAYSFKPFQLVKSHLKHSYCFPTLKLNNQPLSIKVKVSLFIIPYPDSLGQILTCLGQRWLQFYTLFRRARPKSIPCPLACPHIAQIREYPPPSQGVCYCKDTWNSYITIWYFTWTWPELTA